MDPIDANSILEELDIERKRIIRIQELVGTVFRLAMPDPWRLWARTERSHQLSRSDSILQGPWSDHEEQETFSFASAELHRIQQDWELDQEPNLGFGHHWVKWFWASSFDQERVLSTFEIWSLGVPWSVHQVSSEEVRSFARHRERSADRDWIFSFNVGSFCDCSPAARCPH